MASKGSHFLPCNLGKNKRHFFSALETMIGISFIFTSILFTITWVIFRIRFYIKNKPINKLRD